MLKKWKSLKLSVQAIVAGQTIFTIPEAKANKFYPQTDRLVIDIRRALG